MGGTLYVMDGPFWFADVVAELRELPARFGAPLPSSSRDWTSSEDSDARFPPSWYLAARLAAGDADMLARFHVMLRSVNADTDPRWVARGPARMMAGGLEQPNVLLWIREHCAILAPRVWQSLATGIASACSVRVAHPLVDRLFLDESIPMPEDARREYMKYRLPAPDSSLHSQSLSPEPAPVDVVSLLCAAADETADGFERREALLGLATADLAAARDHARSDEGRILEPITSALRRFERAGELEQYLVDVGLLSESFGMPAPQAWNVNDLLSPHMCSFDGKPSSYPNQQDEVLHRLASHAGLRDVVFQEVPPPPSEDDVEDAVGDYTLQAFVGGRCWEIFAESTRWHNVQAMLALCNTLCRDLGMKTRFAELHSNQPGDIRVLVADGEAITRAHDDGILDIVEYY